MWDVHDMMSRMSSPLLSEWIAFTNVEAQDEEKRQAESEGGRTPFRRMRSEKLR